MLCFLDENVIVELDINTQNKVASTSSVLSVNMPIPMNSENSVMCAEEEIGPILNTMSTTHNNSSTGKYIKG